MASFGKNGAGPPGESPQDGFAAGAPEGAAQGFGHGKVILLGEHAVVYGHGALAAGLDLGVRAWARPGRGRLQIVRWGVDSHVDDPSPVGRALSALLRRMEAPPLDFEVDAQIPCGAGLGSSAALASALAWAAWGFTSAGQAAKVQAASAGPSRQVPSVVRAAVDAAEAVFHGTPSGIDAAAALSGALGRFSRSTGWEVLPLKRPLRLCVGLTGKERNTSVLVKRVADLRPLVPGVDRVLETLGALSGEGQAAALEGDLPQLGRLFDVAHGLLAALGVSSAPLEELVHVARSAGALGAKLTGAGGGGAVLALAPAAEETVLSAWRARGFDGFVADVGGGTP